MQHTEFFPSWVMHPYCHFNGIRPTPFMENLFFASLWKHMTFEDKDYKSQKKKKCISTDCYKKNKIKLKHSEMN